MCGIFCTLNCRNFGKSNGPSVAALHKMLGLLKNRGPNGFSQYSVSVSELWTATFAAAVLWMQGPEPVMQPVADSRVNILLWNGDVFTGPFDAAMSDTTALSNTFFENKNLLSSLASICGPYSFVYLDAERRHLYFGRDRLGRHSLLWTCNKYESLMLASVGKRVLSDLSEVPAIGVFRVDLNLSDLHSIILFPYSDLSAESISQAQMLVSFDFEVSTDVIPSPLDWFLPKHCLNKNYLLEFVNSNKGELLESLQRSDMRESINNVLALLKSAVKVRVEKQPGVCQKCLRVSINNCVHSKIAILFSGGLDSTIIAAIASELVPENEPIDLLNVAFEKIVQAPKMSKMERGQAKTHKKEESKYLAPDRISGRKGVEELRKLFPTRAWNFVEIDVSQSELGEERNRVISDLIYPLNSILDESLGCALWFASRGKGTIQQSDYASPARVVLLGMGADELFGGYQRHRTSLKNNGWDGIKKELEIDFARISTRNLGRDDRIVSDHGRQARYPYLDEKLVSYVCSLQPWERCYPTKDFPNGIGDKLLLRLVAWKLNLQYAATLPKRAFQFGSRIANSKEKGSSISERLCNPEKVRSHQ